MNIDLVVFDLESAAVVDMDASAGALQSALATAGVHVTEKAADAVAALPAARALRALLDQSSQETWPVDRLKMIEEDVRRRVLYHYDNDPTLCEVFGMSEAFRRLHDMGMWVAISTPLDRPAARLVLERLGWIGRSLIDACVTIDDVAVGRPFPDMVQAAMRLVRVRDAWRVVKVACDPAGLQQGAAAGCALTIGVKNRACSEEVLARHPHTHLAATSAIVPELIRRFERPTSLLAAWGG